MEDKCEYYFVSVHKVNEETQGTVRGVIETKPFLALSEKGRKTSNQDVCLAIPNLEEYFNSPEVSEYDMFDMEVIQRNIKGKKLGLFGVLDGHGDSGFVAQFAATTLPFRLASSSKFLEGDYEVAFKEAFQQIHQDVAKHHPKVTFSDTSSGTTVSVALISPTHTFLAFLGDSPIATIDFKDRLTIAFKNHDYKNEKERVKAANAWFCASGSKERNRLGLGGLSVFGAIGDCEEDPEFYNSLIDFVVKCKSSYGNLKLHDFIKKMSQEDEYQEKFSQHVCLSGGLTDILEEWIEAIKPSEKDRLKLKADALRRVPETKALKNSDLKSLWISSDGLNFQRLTRFGSKVYSDRHEIVKELMKTKGTDDATVIIIDINELIKSFK